MTQCVGFSREIRKILALKLVLMMNTTLTRWDSKTYKWSVVVRQEPEAGDVLEVSVQYCAKLHDAENDLFTMLFIKVTSYLCVGTLQMVADCLLAVSPHIVYQP